MALIFCEKLFLTFSWNNFVKTLSTPTHTSTFSKLYTDKYVSISGRTLILQGMLLLTLGVHAQTHNYSAVNTHTETAATCQRSSTSGKHTEAFAFWLDRNNSRKAYHFSMKDLLIILRSYYKYETTNFFHSIVHNHSGLCYNVNVHHSIHSNEHQFFIIRLSFVRPHLAFSF